jgi:hypothetical protein
MDWKALGYERQYKNGRLRWVPKEVYQATQDQDTTTEVDSKPL